MNIALGQFASGPDRDANLNTMRRLLATLPDGETDLVVFPEGSMRCFAPGAGSLRDSAEPLDGAFVESLAALAREHQTWIIAGMFERSGGDGVYNTLAIISSDGTLAGAYRKIHLFDAFGVRESEQFLSGPLTPSTIDIAGTCCGLMTCYDLRFPELSRALVERGAEILLVPAAWYQGPLKEDHWTVLLRARAIENTVYVAAAGQPGPQFCGLSCLIDPFGVIIASLAEGAGMVRAEVSRERLAATRIKLPSLEHRRL